METLKGLAKPDALVSSYLVTSLVCSLAFQTPVLSGCFQFVCYY